MRDAPDRRHARATGRHVLPKAFLALAALPLLLPASSALAESSDTTAAGLTANASAGVQRGEVGSSGGLSYSVGFEVPPFHGVAPAAGLDYDSANPKFGDAGVQAGAGWRIRGLSRVALT